MYKIIKRKSKTASKEIASSKETTSFELPSKDWLFSHNTIISSVQLEEGSDHLIKPKTSKFVNDNSDCWSNQAIVANYQSFIGGWNYVNHVQNPDKSIGFIADAVLRRIQVDSKTHVYYCDILVATDRSAQMCKLVEEDRVKYMSMGCDSAITYCSKCGNILREETDRECDCLSMNRGKYWVDETANRRIIAEISGDHRKGSCKFIEASFLTEVPAFGGALLNKKLTLPKDSSVSISLPNSHLDKPALKKYLSL